MADRFGLESFAVDFIDEHPAGIAATFEEQQIGADAKRGRRRVAALRRGRRFRARADRRSASV